MTLDDAKRVIQIVEACLKEVGVDPETGKRDFDVIAVGKSKSQQERIKSIRDIIRELEREAGSAHIDTIVERASKLGFEKDKVEAEIARLVQDAADMLSQLGTAVTIGSHNNKMLENDNVATLTTMYLKSYSVNKEILVAVCDLN